MTRFVFPKIYDMIRVNITEIIKCMTMTVKQVSGPIFYQAIFFLN